MRREIIFYETVDGKCPVKDFFDSLPRKVFQKITWVLQLVQELERIPTLYFKKIAASDEIWECRIGYSSNIYRIFCFFNKGNIIVLTNGFMKKTKKTPHIEIMKAEECRNDYLRRTK